MMKRITAVFLSLLFCLLFSLTAFADDIYIVDDGEDVFVPVTETTTVAAEETTTASSSDSGIGSFFEGFGSIDEYLGEFSGILGGGIDSILSGFENNFGQFDTVPTTAAENTTSLPSIDTGERPTQSQQLTTIPAATPAETTASENVTASGQKSEVASVLIVNGETDSQDGISGSTLTLLVFVAAIVVLILAAAIVLVIMTRRTEYHSAVMDKSTIPSVSKPRAMSQFSNDNIGDDGNDYSNITYWND